MVFDKSYKILIVDDAKDSQMLLSFDLQSAGCEVISADSGEMALSILKSTAVDLIILDMHMPGLSGLSTLRRLKSNIDWQKISVIMLSSSDGEDDVVSALELGADDYVVKPYIGKVLFTRMRTALRLKEKTKALEDLAKTDFLTGIKNRACFYELASSAISQTKRTESPLVMAMFDIDFFKRVNDYHGHDAGDKVLINFAKCLTECFRDYDIIARIGGEEFAVCLPNTLIDEAMLACERFRKKIERMKVPLNDGSNEEISITVSVGVASYTNATVDVTFLLKEADVGLYYAKSHGRNQVVNTDWALNNDITIMDNSKEPSTAFSIEGIDVNMGMGNVLGDEKLFKDILIMFYQDHHEDADKLTIAIENNNIETLKQLVHTLKGVACSVGAMSLFDVAKLLDIAMNNQQHDTYEALLKNVVTQLVLVMSDISDKLDTSIA